MWTATLFMSRIGLMKACWCSLHRESLSSRLARGLIGQLGSPWTVMDTSMCVALIVFVSTENILSIHPGNREPFCQPQGLLLDTHFSLPSFLPPPRKIMHCGPCNCTIQFTFLFSASTIIAYYFGSHIL